MVLGWLVPSFKAQVPSLDRYAPRPRFLRLYGQLLDYVGVEHCYSRDHFMLAGRWL